MLINAYLTADDHVGAAPSAPGRLSQRRAVRGAALALAALAFIWTAAPGVIEFAASLGRMADLRGLDGLLEPGLIGTALIGAVLMMVAARAVLDLVGHASGKAAQTPPSATDMATLAADGATGVHSYSISPRGLRIVSAGASQWFDWSLVTSCADTRQTLSICIGRHHKVVLPKSAMPEPGHAARVKSAIHGFAGASVVARPARTNRLRPHEDDIVTLHGRITQQDIIERMTWQKLASLSPGWRAVQSWYLTPFGLFSAASTSGAASVMALSHIDPQLWSSIGSFSPVALGDVLTALFAMCLLAGFFSSFVHLLRRVTGLPLGLPIGPRLYLWGTCDISLTEDGVARATQRYEERHAWSAFSTLAEAEHLFILTRSPAKCFVIPKRFFNGAEAEAAFRDLVGEKLRATSRGLGPLARPGNLA